MKDITDFFDKTPKKTNDALEETGKNSRKRKKRRKICSTKSNVCSENSHIKNFKKKSESLDEARLRSSSKKDENRKEEKKTQRSENVTNQSGSPNCGVLILDVQDEVKNDQKLNAFQLMMDSRNKVIGANLSGKEPSECDDLEEEKSPDKLRTRKKMLKKWADRKGAVKRRREEVDKDEIIRVKLRKRVKRLKKLLNVDQSTSDLVDSAQRRRTKKLSSSSESSVDFAPSVKDNGLNKDESARRMKKKAGTSEILTQIQFNENARGGNSKPANTKNGLFKNFFKAVDKSKSDDEIVIVEDRTEKEVSTARKACTAKSKSKDKTERRTVANLYLEPKTKSKHKKGLENVKKTEAPTDESSQESVHSNHSIKSWKLKIKINLDDEEADKIKNHLNTVSEENVVRSCSTSTVSISSDEELQKKKNSNNSVKLAPVFAKALPKPKVDILVLEARKRFLMSGTPESLRKKIEKQRSVEERDYNIFPSVSHVQQKCNNVFWNLPLPALDLLDVSDFDVHETDLTCKGLTASSQVSNKLNMSTEVRKVDRLKVFLNEIKQNNPSYPVNKSFRLISEKSGKLPTCSPKKKRGRRKKNKEENAAKCAADLAMWTEKYRPKSSEDIVGNAKAVEALKKWLETWRNCSQEINSKRVRRGSSSSEFESADGDSRDSGALPGNTIILGGPCGSGKSAAVYGVCNELGFSVIEVNASSKRTGKKLMQELQEATQSHQVRKEGGAGNLTNFLEADTSKQKIEPNKEPLAERKMCVLLVEDIDVVFEQDDGFVSGLTQIISTSKRPVILTTTDYGSLVAQRFIEEHRYVLFSPLPSSLLSVWLQVLCLVEGIPVKKEDIAGLLDFNKGDVRKTLLQLQFWVQSGGQLSKDEMPLAITHGLDENTADDKDVHANCIRSFEIFESHTPFAVPYRMNLGFLWWNMPHILGLPDLSKQRLDQRADVLPKRRKSDRAKLRSAYDVYDSLSFADVAFRQTNRSDDGEPFPKNYPCDVKDSLELGERMHELASDQEFVHEVTHAMVDGCVKVYNRIDGRRAQLNVGVPTKAERRWRTKLNVCEGSLKEAIFLSSCLERKSVALDYLPTLRNISRSESRRAACNTKRGSRFRSYFRELGVNWAESTVKLACDIMQEPD